MQLLVSAPKLKKFIKFGILDYMKVSVEAKIAITAAAISFAAGAAVAKYGHYINDIFVDSSSPPGSSESSGLTRCPPGSVNVESAGESALSPNIGLAPGGTICSLDK